LDAQARQGVEDGCIVVLESTGTNPPAEWRAQILDIDDRRPVILSKIYGETSLDELQIKAAADFGMIFIDGLADGIRIVNPGIPQHKLDTLALSILQAARVRISHTEYIACPGCGRTLYDLQGTLAAIRSRTSHLAGLKIGVMGCIVNGPGEMADADYGYVGEGGGRVSIYRGREVVSRGVAQEQAIDELIEVIKASGDWHEPI
jgi:(E)-4-hydroxy-3-methylbut-2-enyl-diphosphate synthase